MPITDYYYVYILVSKHSTKRHYIGCTKDLEARLKKHNKGDCPHTKKNRPWVIETAVAFRSKKKAISFEAYLKKGSGREFSRRHF